MIKSKNLGYVTDDLAKMLMLLVDRYSRSPKFNRYSYREDMKSEAIINLACNAALKFNPEKSSNPFAFYTTVIHNSFIQFLNSEKKQRNIRDMLLVEAGENPSYNYQESGQDYADDVYGSKMDSDNIGIEQTQSNDDSYAELGAEVQINDDDIPPFDITGEDTDEPSYYVGDDGQKVLIAKYQEGESRTKSGRFYGNKKKIVDESKLPKKVLKGKHIQQFVEFS